jgi:hypothetical protein
MERISFLDTESGEMLEAYVLEQTVLGGVNYLLVTEEEEEDSVAYILKEIHTQNTDVLYEIVSDEVELESISKIFSEMLEDVDFEL